MKKFGKTLFVGVFLLAVVAATSFIVPNAFAHNNNCEGGYCTVAEKAIGEGVISVEDAKNIAFAHAKVNANDAVIKKVKLDYEHGIRVYEVEFLANGYEYEYDINAVTGDIVKFEREKKKNHW